MVDRVVTLSRTDRPGLIGKGERRSSMTARFVNIALGVWLVMSAFLWPHSVSQFWNAISVGFFVAAAALLASETAPTARYLNTAFGIWLVISSFIMGSVTAATIWNHVIVGAAVLIFSLLPNLPAFGRPGPRLPSPR
jgi:phosphoglycerol transferase MdoB-like AlkP superfamily enzyme